MIDNITNYEIIKLEPSHILMKNKQTRKVYRYVEQSTLPDKDCLKNITSKSTPFQHIVHPIFVQTGILYDAGFMALSKQISSGLKSGAKCTYEEKQIINTIQPILKLAMHLHKLGEVHGNLSADSIIIDEMGNIRVYYPGLKQPAKFYYSSEKQQIKPEDDYRCIAKIILQLLGYELQSEQNSNCKAIYEDQIKILKSIAKLQKYNHFFIFALLSMLNKKNSFNQQVLTMIFDDNFENNFERLSNDAKEYFQAQILSKDKKIEQIKRIDEKQKIQFTPPLAKHLDHTPKKPIQNKKYIKAQDVENKKYFEQGKKKKPIEQVLKKVSNSKNETQNNSNPNSASPSYKKILRDIRETKERQDLFRMAVTKRMRTLSKKKIG